MSPSFPSADPVGAAPPRRRFAAQAFGLRWRSDWPIPGLGEAPDDGRSADVLVERAEALARREGGRRVNRGELFADGTRFTFDGAVIDMFDGERVRWFDPRAQEVPFGFYGTVVAHLLAWRGLVPIHGSAVAFDGAALLIAGPSGAGKSTLADALVELGGTLVSDDLSVMTPLSAGRRPMLLPGRPAIRLVATPGADKQAPKRLVRRPLTDPDAPVPLTLLLLLRDQPIGASPAERAAAVLDQQFRPLWMRQLPHAKARTQSLLHASQGLLLRTMPPAASARDVTPARRAEQALALLRGAGASG